MRTFAEKLKAIRQSAPAKPLITSRACSEQNSGQSSRQTPKADSILHLQRTIGNQALQRLGILQQLPGGAPTLQRQNKPAPEMKLVDDFGAKFHAAAELVKANPAAMKLVKEAFDAGATFGGFSEDGPDKDSGRAYTIGHAVYVPKTKTDPVLAMNSFLFELNNAIRQPAFAALAAAATKGKKTDTAAAKKYARDKVEQEVEGMLRLGEVWFESRSKYSGAKAEDLASYDRWFYLQEYQSFKDKKKTKDDIIKDVLQRTYDTGTLRGKTVEQHYMEQYQSLAQ